MKLLSFEYMPTIYLHIFDIILYILIKDINEKKIYSNGVGCYII